MATRELSVTETISRMDSIETAINALGPGLIHLAQPLMGEWHRLAQSIKERTGIDIRPNE